ncbi:MAG: RHS repeat-associated core domain-containing protein [Kiritimatiellia bacterium]
MTYDLANRLLTATGKQEARYAYDPAGRIKEEILGGRATQYEYGLLGKVSRVKEGDTRQVNYQYWPDGQTAWKEKRQPDAHTSKPYNTTTSYLWDGLALLARGEENFTIEPHISGGVPVMASGKEGQTVVISDFLGTTLGVVKGEEFVPTSMTAFGETPSREPGTVNREPDFEGFFTGKPYDSDLKAYTFLFRNYRPELGRWTAKDPAGFPDGANNQLLCNNSPVNSLDPIGLVVQQIHMHSPDCVFWTNHRGDGQDWYLWYKSWINNTVGNGAYQTDVNQIALGFVGSDLLLQFNSDPNSWKAYGGVITWDYSYTINNGIRIWTFSFHVDELFEYQKTPAGTDYASKRAIDPFRVTGQYQVRQHAE